MALKNSLTVFCQHILIILSMKWASPFEICIPESIRGKSIFQKCSFQMDKVTYIPVYLIKSVQNCGLYEYETVSCMPQLPKHHTLWTCFYTHDPKWHQRQALNYAQMQATFSFTQRF